MPFSSSSHRPGVDAWRQALLQGSPTELGPTCQLPGNLGPGPNRCPTNQGCSSPLLLPPEESMWHPCPPGCDVLTQQHLSPTYQHMLTCATAQNHHNCGTGHTHTGATHTLPGPVVKGTHANPQPSHVFT